MGALLRILTAAVVSAVFLAAGYCRGEAAAKDEKQDEAKAAALAKQREYELTRLCPDIEDIQILPPDNPWNTDISEYPVHPNSDAFIRSVGPDKPLHPEFGPPWDGRPSGIPYILVKGDQPRVPVEFRWPDECEPGPYPIPENAPVEGGSESEGDKHVLVIDVDNNLLYETWFSVKGENGWTAGSGAVFDLTSNKLRPIGWTSADAAGLPILPGLVRYQEVMEKGELNHAIRVTVSRTQQGFVLPATHFASRSKDPDLPPMGLRLRLKADYDVSGFPEPVRVILKGLKKYGMIVADNGGDWFITGAPDPRWDDAVLATMKVVKGGDFEAVDTGEIRTTYPE
jgi:hypothetical protein